jgi:DNA-binding IclR family transcriptional regulator
MPRKKRTASDDVLDALGTASGPLTVVEIVERSGRARSTVVNALVMMQRADLLTITKRDGKDAYALQFPGLYPHLKR